MGWLKSLLRWKHYDPVEEINSQIRWLTDNELAALTDAMEAEMIDRQAIQAGYVEMSTQEWVYENAPDLGDLFTIEEWKQHLESGVLIPDDGSACWADAKHHVDYGDPFDLSTKPDWATHVMWFNK